MVTDRKEQAEAFYLHEGENVDVEIYISERPKKASAPRLGSMWGGAAVTAILIVSACLFKKHVLLMAAALPAIT